MWLFFLGRLNVAMIMSNKHNIFSKQFPHYSLIFFVVLFDMHLPCDANR